MRDLLNEYDRLGATGRVGRAVVTRVWGSAPRPEGACLLATPDGRMAGSVSGGCVEGGGAAGGRWAAHRPARRRRRKGAVVAPLIGGNGPAPVGAGLLLEESGARRRFGELRGGLEEMIAAQAAGALAGLTSRVESLDTADGPVEVFLEVFPRRPTLLVFGGVHIATALVRLAKPLGFRTVVADGREAFLPRERFPDADELILGWPDEVFRKVGLDPATCVCLLTHDPKFDEPALDLALRSPACYV